MRKVAIINSVLVNADTADAIYCPLIHEGIHIAPCSVKCAWFNATDIAPKKGKSLFVACCKDTQIGSIERIEKRDPAPQEEAPKIIQ
jgi:hypothetical protein